MCNLHYYNNVISYRQIVPLFILQYAVWGATKFTFRALRKRVAKIYDNSNVAFDGVSVINYITYLGVTTVLESWRDKR